MRSARFTVKLKFKEVPLNQMRTQQKACTAMSRIQNQLKVQGNLIVPVAILTTVATSCILDAETPGVARNH